MICLTTRDREALAADPALRGQRAVACPLHRAGSGRRPGPGASAGEPARLLAVGMMREGDKLASYRLLAEALARIADRPWTLAIAGDGPARPAVALAFARFGARVTLHGALPPDALAPLYAASDLLVWPAVNEAFGMALLEAQAAGCPVVAGEFGGVADACRPGRTAILCPPGDAAALAAAAASLLDDPARLARMGREAARFVAAERSLEGAAAVLGTALLPLVRRIEAAA